MNLPPGGTLHIPWRIKRAIERARLQMHAWRRSPTVVPAPEGSLGSQGSVRLVALGDVALTRPNEIDGARAFAYLMPQLAAADLCTANLEAGLTSAMEPAGTIGSFVRAEPAMLDVIRRLRLDVANVANNHALDFGTNGLQESVGLLGTVGIDACGVVAGDGRSRLVVRDVRGMRVGFLGFCDDHFPVRASAEDVLPALAWEDELQLRVAEACAEVDSLVVHLHWGYEFALHPLLRHRDLARRLIELGAHVVLCHHAHVPMAVEPWGRGVIAHGLGNGLMRLSPYLKEGHPWTNRSYLLEVSITPRGVSNYCLYPYRIKEDWTVAALDAWSGAGLAGGLQRMRVRLSDSNALRRFEHARLNCEATRCIQTLMDASQRAGPSVVERAGALALPRQQHLLEFLSRDPRTSPAASILRDLSSFKDMDGDTLRVALRPGGASAEVLSRAVGTLRPDLHRRDMSDSRVP